MPRILLPLVWAAMALALPTPALDAQAAATNDPVAILKSALKAHRGSTKAYRPTRLLFHGTVIAEKENGDTNSFNLDQWYERIGNADTIATLLRASGTASESRGGFDGKKHYLVLNGNKRTVIDYNNDYKRDLERIKEELARTRLIIDTFFAASVLAKPTELRYVRRSKSGDMESHVIDHAPGGRLKTRFYVNAKAGQPPYLLGVEFPRIPKTKDSDGAPKQNICFSTRRIKRFGGIAISQDMRIFHNDGKEPVAKIWITKLSVDPKERPDWKWLP